VQNIAILTFTLLLRWGNCLQLQRWRNNLRLALPGDELRFLVFLASRGEHLRGRFHDDVAPAEFTTYFRSAIACGSIRVSNDEADMIAATSALAQKYYPGHDAEHAKVIESAKARMLAIIMDVDCLTGKEAIELVR
jgi:hypothetical protein